MSFSLNPIEGIVTAVGEIIDSVHTSDEERMALDLKGREIDASIDRGQLAVNAEEAKSSSLFVAGWRPAIGWIGALALGYQFILYPFMVWGWTFAQSRAWVSIGLAPPPMLDTDALWVILSGMLGIAGMRTFEKHKGVAG